jgi:hypothetical protein
LTWCCLMVLAMCRMLLSCLFLIDRNLFWGLKTIKKQDTRGFIFPVFFGGIFHRNVVLEGVAGIPVFCRCHRIFFAGIPVGQEFLYLLLIPPDSSGFLQIPPDSCSRQMLSCSGQQLK